MELEHSRGVSSRATGLVLAALLLGATSGLLGVCGPFSDVAGDAFCTFVLEIFTLGITTGTTPATYDPTANVSRLQMAVFLSRTVDGVLKRGTRRTALQKFAVANSAAALALTTVGDGPRFVACDGADVWVTNNSSSSVSRVRASDGRLLETWTGATGANAVHSDMGRIFVDRDISPGVLYTINPAQAAGVVTTVATNLGAEPDGIAFDGGRIWTANKGGSVSIVTPGATVPWTVTTVTAGFSSLRGAIFDGAKNVWVTDNVPDTAGLLMKLDQNGAILQTVTVGGSAHYPAFDGTNFWVPVQITDSVAVVRGATGALLQTLTGNGLSAPRAAAFDGERILVASSNDRVSLWKAADLSPLGFASTVGSTPVSAASDGINFWVVFFTPGKLARF